MSARIHPVRIAVFLAVLGAAHTAAAAPARAGGIGDALSPAMGNGCVTHRGDTSVNGGAGGSRGSTAGNRLGVPFAGSTNQCGGADLPAALPRGGVGRNILNLDLFGEP
ncbi:hypothetical protein ABT104_01735 [Streptomyces mobaraensis]|uniref:hypothetical protein n=1 Tax=Streptomyces mobaraensis TaxID=35621 RepID=UPI00331B787A